MSFEQSINPWSHRIAIIAAAVALSGCVATYSMVEPGSTPVAKNSLVVQPSSAWNKIPGNRSQINGEESWTRNGPILDAISFVAGVPDGGELAKYNAREERRIPVFRTDMTPPDFVSMVEANYRIRGGVTVFTMTDMQPVTFLGANGIQMDYDYIGGDDLKRKGRTVLAVVNDKLYMMTLDGATLHYFDASLPEFESMVAQARLP